MEPCGVWIAWLTHRSGWLVHVSQEKLNELARRVGARFVSAEARGLCGSLFTDCGEEFTVVDRDGREPATGVIARIVQQQVGEPGEGKRGLYEHLCGA